MENIEITDNELYEHYIGDMTDADSDEFAAYMESMMVDIQNAVPTHPPTAECKDAECEICAYRDCPHHDTQHYHHDGCPSCY
jgi:hypothetical protein